MRDILRRIALHRSFWSGAPMDEPIVTYRIGDYFFANKFKANLPLLENGRPLAPEDVDVDAYLEDYERMYMECESTGQSGFFACEPCTGIPWIEGMMGCPISGGSVSFVATHVCDSLFDIDIGELKLDHQNPWLLKYIEFLDKLTALAAGRFPVGQPIIRGTTDVIGTMIGHSELACSAITDPEIMREALSQIAEVQREIIAEQYRHIKPFHGGYAAGFYHLWAPGTIIWYQEDLSAILSKHHFDEYIRDTSEHICSGYDYSFVHLHPNSFFHLDGILSLQNLSAVQINKDVGGPSVEKMLPLFRQVVAADKRLILWGDFTPEEVTMVMDALPHKGLAFNIVASTVDDAKGINEIIVSRWR